MKGTVINLIQQILPAHLQADPNESIVLISEWTELFQIWSGQRMISGAFKLLLDFMLLHFETRAIPRRVKFEIQAKFRTVRFPGKDGRNILVNFSFKPIGLSSDILMVEATPRTGNEGRQRKRPSTYIGRRNYSQHTSS